MPPSYDHEALWVKAKLFLNHAMDDSDHREFEERALWASLALELLAKAALARTSPLLIAEPSEEGTHLLMASGLIEADARFTSVRAQTIYKRCQKAFKPFSLQEATAITNARNEYLHGAGVGFYGLPPNVWWARYWAQAAILVNALDSDIEALVGQDRVNVVDSYLIQNAKNLEHRVEMLLERAKQRLAVRESGTLSSRLSREWDTAKDLRAGLAHSAEEICPACGNLASIEGDDVINSEVKHEQVAEDDFISWAELEVGADYFSCQNCRLVLDSYELLDAAGVATQFEAEGDAADYFEPDYGND